MNQANGKIELIRDELERLKRRMDNIEDILNSQEELLEMLTENTKYLLLDAINSSKEITTPEEIMKTAFSSKKIPNILKK